MVLVLSLTRQQIDLQQLLELRLSAARASPKASSFSRSRLRSSAANNLSVHADASTISSRAFRVLSLSVDDLVDAMAGMDAMALALTAAMAGMAAMAFTCALHSLVFSDCLTLEGIVESTSKAEKREQQKLGGVSNKCGRGHKGAMACKQV